MHILALSGALFPIPRTPIEIVCYLSLMGNTENFLWLYTQVCGKPIKAKFRLLEMWESHSSGTLFVYHLILIHPNRQLPIILTILCTQYSAGLYAPPCGIQKPAGQC